MKVNKYIMKTGLLITLFVLSACTESTENSQDSQPTEETVEESTEIEDTNNSGEDIEEETDTSDDNLEDSENESDETVEEEEENQDTVSIDLEEDILQPDSVRALVNKNYALPEDYAPADLVMVEVPTILENPEVNQLREIASDALTEMFAAAKEEGLHLYARSGYRSYQTQVQLFDGYVQNHGEEAANRYSARPGESEHQTGLAMDVTSESANYQLSEAFGSTPEGIWVEENAADFGFIIRYLEGTEDITGYQFEPWHLRYLGEELARDVYESGLTYETYLIERGLDIETGE